MKTRVITFRLCDGEHYRSLVDTTTSAPVPYANLYVTTQIRNASKSVATMEMALRSIQLLIEFCDKFDIDLKERFGSGKYLTSAEMDQLRDSSQLNLSEEQPQRRNMPKNLLAILRPPPATVSNHYQHQRLTHIADYLGWCARTALGRSLSHELNSAIDHMVQGIRARRPRSAPKWIAPRNRALTSEQLALLMELSRPAHPDNPFLHADVAARNELLIHLLVKLAIRRGELLGIRVRDIDFMAPNITIHRRPDEPDDPRRNQPKAKTAARMLPLASQLANRVRTYIMEYRRRIPGAEKHDYLLVVHHPGPHQGQPITLYGLDKIFARIRKSAPELQGLHPHRLRHTWNWLLSRAIDAMPPDCRPTPAVEEQIRNHHNGWLQGSDTASAYNRRHIEYQAQKASLHLQELIDREILHENLH